MYKNIINGIIETIILKTKNCSLFQKSAPSIIQKNKNANKFAKIIHEIRISFLYILVNKKLYIKIINSFKNQINF